MLSQEELMFLKRLLKENKRDAIFVKILNDQKLLGEFIIKKEMLICYTKDFLSGWTFALWLFVVRYVDPLVIVGILFYALAQSFKH